jgi:hypothetical protein
LFTANEKVALKIAQKLYNLVPPNPARETSRNWKSGKSAKNFTKYVECGIL